jgi:hypothetical protein
LSGEFSKERLGLWPRQWVQSQFNLGRKKMDIEQGMSLVERAKRFGMLSRRNFLASAAGTGAALAGGVSLVNDAVAQDIVVPKTGKKVRVGLGLNYGPFNQPWRRGCWQLPKNGGRTRR